MSAVLAAHPYLSWFIAGAYGSVVLSFVFDEGHLTVRRASGIIARGLLLSFLGWLSAGVATLVIVGGFFYWAFNEEPTKTTAVSEAEEILRRRH